MDKKVLILCTGNSCRSIIAEALINAKCKNIKAYSAGVNPSGKVHEYAKKILVANEIWSDTYRSKDIDAIRHIDFDLVITVCDNAKQTCPSFDVKTKVAHVGFADPDGKDFIDFEKTYKQIENILLSKIEKILGN